MPIGSVGSHGIVLGALLTYLNSGGGENPSDVFRSEILAQSVFFGSMKDDGIFFGSQKR